jgi:hypothetical protein
MSFLEITKRHLARQESARSLPGIRSAGGHIMRRIIWKSETAIVFQDHEGHFWRYLIDSRRSKPAVIKAKIPLTPSDSRVNE